MRDAEKSRVTVMASMTVVHHAVFVSPRTTGLAEERCAVTLLSDQTHNKTSDRLTLKEGLAPVETRISQRCDVFCPDLTKSIKTTANQKSTWTESLSTSKLYYTYNTIHNYIV